MVDKFTKQPTNKEVVSKINDVIDAMGTVKKVNNTSPDGNGNVTIAIPSIADLANKDLSNLSTNGNSKFQAPLVSGTNIKTVNNQSLLGSGNITVGGGTATDVRINGTSITSNNVANIPLSGTDTIGVAKANAAYGVYNNNSTLTISKATDAQIAAKTSQYRPLVPYNIDLAVKTGITTNSLTLTAEEKTAAQNWLGISSTTGANTDLSNLSETGKKVIDGAIIWKFLDIISRSTTSAGTYDYTSTMQEYLPSDSYNYEVLLKFQNNAASNTYTITFLQNGTLDDIQVAACRNDSARYAANCFWLPILGDRTFKMRNTAKLDDVYCTLYAYRRIGANT